MTKDLTREQMIKMYNLRVRLKICCLYYKEFGFNAENEKERVMIKAEIKKLKKESLF